MTKVRAAFLGNPAEIERVFGAGRRDRIEALADVVSGVVQATEFEDNPELSDLEVLFSTWGMPLLSDRQLDRLPNLKVVFYAAGAVDYFIEPLRARGIIVSSAIHANSMPVAEFALSQILLAGKGYFRNVREYGGRGKSATHGAGNFRSTVALLGAGTVGFKLINLLLKFNIEILVFDPFLTEVEADTYEVEKVDLEEAFTRGMVVSNHMADNSETAGLIGADLFRRLPPGATFINTGRGRTVREDDLAEVMEDRTDLTALLDVTYPEPPSADNRLLHLPNVIISSHIAGSIGNEVHRMADMMIEEFIRFCAGDFLFYRVY